MPSNFYDVIVTGDDLAGLIAATLCARRGMRVLIAEPDAGHGERYHVGPYVLPRTPLPFAIETSPALRRVIAELNFIQTMRRRAVPLRPAFQVVLPDARLDIGPDPEVLLRELDRELPSERGAVEQFLARAGEVSKVLEPVLGQDVSIPPDGFWERREIARSESRLPNPDEDLFPGVPEGHPVRALMALPAALTLGLDPRALTPTAILRSFDLWRRGASRVEGGRETLRTMLLEKLRTQHAGEVRTLDLGQVQTRWGKVSGLSLRDRDETLGASQILCGSPIAEFGDLFGDKRPKRILQFQRAITPTAYRYVLHLVVSESGIPEGLAPICFVCVDPGKPLMGENAFGIFLSEPDEEGRVVVTIACAAPAPGDGETLDDVFTALRPRLRARVEEVMPFVNDHVLVAHAPGSPRPPEGIKLPEGAKIPLLLPEPLWSSSLPLALGIGALPYDVGVRGVTAACSQNLPGLGLEGDFAAGWCGARLVSQAAGKKIDYLKDEVLLGT